MRITKLYTNPGNFAETITVESKKIRINGQWYCSVESLNNNWTKDKTLIFHIYSGSFPENLYYLDAKIFYQKDINAPAAGSHIYVYSHNIKDLILLTSDFTFGLYFMIYDVVDGIDYQYGYNLEVEKYV